MSNYETSTTVGGHGDIHLSGVPFQPGTEVEIVVSPKHVDSPSAVDTIHRLSTLLSALAQAHNTEPIGSLRREELHDRDILH
jgi:hypothetical protein